MDRRNLLRAVLMAGLSCFTSESAGIDSPEVNPAWVAYGARWGEFVEADFPFVSSTLDARDEGNGLPANNLTPRGLLLNLGHDGWACFDLDLLRLSAVWVGQGVTPVSMAQISYHSPGTKIGDGQSELPKLRGTVWLANGIYPGWQVGEQYSLTDPREPGPDPNEVGRGALNSAAGRFKSIRLNQESLVLEYAVGGVNLREWIEFRSRDSVRVFQRRVRLEATSETLWLVLGQLPKGSNLHWFLRRDLSENPATTELVQDADGVWLIKLRPSVRGREFRVGLSSAAGVTNWPSSPGIEAPANARWLQSFVTQSVLSSATNAYVVDNIALPLDNPYRRNIRITDIGFFKDGTAAAVTFDGDVWMVSGLIGDLSRVRWRRFASGLNEPQSLCIRGDELFIFDRNGIWRLRDTDRNGEADRYELFSNAFAQTAETREYAQSMKLAPDGSFIIAKGGIQTARLGKHNGSVLRVSPDGQTARVLARGLRSPYLGVHPQSGLITASDQQGHYVPTTPLQIIGENQFYGFLSSLQSKEKYPAPIADPLLWIPYPVNASGACQTWLVGAQMGPINDALIHFGYYRPEIFLVLPHHRGHRLQGAVVSVARDLPFPPFDGVLNPLDGQLYFAGFQIFGSSAKQISGLGRLRYTGAPSQLPREIVAFEQGILLQFDVPIDERAATDPANYSAERWNYRRTSNYGSPHFKLDGNKGQEVMVPTSAYLSKDGKRIFVGIPDMKPVMQMRMGWSLVSRDGLKLEQNGYLTPYELPRLDPAAEGFEPIRVDLTPRAARQEAVTVVSTQEGKRIAELMGCLACHSIDGSVVGKVGPSWKDLFGSEVFLADGSKAVANEKYLRESIKEPTVKVVRGFDKSETGMPSYEGVISESQIDALILYIKSL